MHILEIPSFFTPYGGEFCLEQAKALKALGHEVRILSNVQLSIRRGLTHYLASFPTQRFWREQEGIEVYQSYQRGLPLVICPNVERWIGIVRAMFGDYVERYGVPDILHAHCAKWAGRAALELSRLYGVRYVITEHLSRRVFEQEFGSAPSTAWQIPLLREAYDQAAMVIPVAEELVGDISCYFGSAYRWLAVSNIIDTDFFSFRERNRLQGRAFRFCCLAHYTPLKGYDVLTEAFSRLRGEGADVELHIAGRDTERAPLTAGMRSYGLLDKAGVRQLLYESDALVLASSSEVQPLALMEAMSTGIPVVATEVTPRCLRLGDGCQVVPVGDSSSLAAAMRRVMGWNQAEGRQLSARMAAMASTRAVARQLERVFSEAIASR